MIQFLLFLLNIHLDLGVSKDSWFKIALIRLGQSKHAAIKDKRDKNWLNGLSDGLTYLFIGLLEDQDCMNFT